MRILFFLLLSFQLSGQSYSTAQKLTTECGVEITLSLHQGPELTTLDICIPSKRVYMFIRVKNKQIKILKENNKLVYLEINFPYVGTYKFYGGGQPLAM